MNTMVADPHWGWWIVWYFYLAGIASGAFAVTCLLRLVKSDTVKGGAQTEIADSGEWIAAPLMAVCGLLLIVDLGRPERFWHMLFDRDSWLPHIKVWSPMSVGAWGVLVFSMVTGIGFLATLNRSGVTLPFPLERVSRLCGSVSSSFPFSVFGLICAMFISSYTGALLTATNQPVWSETAWIGALFLASSVGTGTAAVQLVARARGGVSSSLEAFEPYVWALELTTLVLFVSSIEAESRTVLWRDGRACGILAVSVLLCVLVPAALRWRARHSWGWLPFGAVSVLAGGFLLRYAIVMAPTMWVSPTE